MALLSFKNDVPNYKAEHVRYTSLTKAVLETIDIEWQINDFSYLVENIGFKICSPSYSSKQNPQIKWHLLFYPNGQMVSSKEYCALFLCYEGPQGGVTARSTVTVWDKHNKIFLASKETIHTFAPGDNSDWGYREFMKRSLLTELLKNNSLKITCTINVTLDGMQMSDVKYLNGQNKLQKTNDQKSNMNIGTSHNLNVQQFFECKEFSDIQLITEAEVFNVHKVILCCASPIFREIFKNLSPKSTSVSIKDISPSILKEMLRYIYTNNIDNLSGIAHELVEAAHKYQMIGLKKLCENSLCNYLSKENLLDMLIIAETYNLSKLYEEILNFFILNKSEIASTEKFKDLTICKPSIIANLFSSLLSKNKI